MTSEEEAAENERAFAERAEKRRAYVAALPEDTPAIDRAAAAAYMEFFPGPHPWHTAEEGAKEWMRRVVRGVLESVREPTLSMWSAGSDHIHEGSTELAWQAMIDVALQERLK